MASRPLDDYVRLFSQFEVRAFGRKGVLSAHNGSMEEDLVPTEVVTRMLDRHLRLPARWDAVERREFIDDAAREVAYRVAELADDWADRAVTEWGRWHRQLPNAETQADLVRRARRSALIDVLCDVLPTVSIAEFDIDELASVERT